MTTMKFGQGPRNADGSPRDHAQWLYELRLDDRPNWQVEEPHEVICTRCERGKIACRAVDPATVRDDHDGTVDSFGGMFFAHGFVCDDCLNLPRHRFRIQQPHGRA